MGDWLNDLIQDVEQGNFTIHESREGTFDMSRVTYVMDRTWCSELEDVRKMWETRDFSGISAVIERLQSHGNAMEDGIWRHRHAAERIDSILQKDKKPKEKLTEIQKVIDDWKKKPK